MPLNLDALTDGQRCWVELASDIVDARVAEGLPIELARRFAKGQFKIRVFSEGYGDVQIYRTLFELTDLGWFEESRPGSFVLADLRLCRYLQPGAVIPPPPPRSLRYHDAGRLPFKSEIHQRIEDLRFNDGLGERSTMEDEAIRFVLDDSISDYVIEGFMLDRRGPYGLGHWCRVMHEGLRLATAMQANHRVVAWFSLLHDRWRLVEGEDPGHAQRGADEVERFIDQGLLDLDDRSGSQLIEAIRWHSSGELHDDPTVACCWDADRLDCIRFGIEPDPSRLSTHAARNAAALRLEKGRSADAIAPPSGVSE